MDAFTAGYLANLASALTIYLTAGARKSLRQALSGSEIHQALNHCVQTGLVALLSMASAQSPQRTDLLADIFSIFFTDEEVGEEVGRELEALLRGKPLDIEALMALFEQAGFDPQTLPDLDFEQGMLAFEAAFLTAAADEPSLQTVIQSGNLLTQSRLQHEMLSAMRQLLNFMRQNQFDISGIRAGTITAQNVANQIHIHQILPRDLPALSGNWEKHYLEALITRCDPLDLTPIDETHPQGTQLDQQARTVHISQVFTSLYLAGLTRTPEQDVVQALRQPSFLEKTLGFARGRSEDERQPIQAVEAIAVLERLVILGHPGGGKSTLVNYLVTQLARRRLGRANGADTLPGWSPAAQPLPVRIILRRFAAWLPVDTLRGRAGLVWDYLEHDLKGWGLAEYFSALKQTLLEEGGIIFFDGLDEVQEKDEAAKRTFIKEAIAAIAADLKRCRVVVTCREYAYNPPKQPAAAYTWRLPESDFPVVELALFKPEQIEAFTQTWYRVVGPHKGWTEAKSQSEAANLYRAIDAFPHLRELAQYPLLLTLMAQAHGRDGYLPRDRADLYERAVNLLLAHWENRIVRDTAGGQRVEPGLVMQLGIRTDTLRAALERVAFAAHERQEQETDRSERAADIPREDLRDILAADLGSVDRADQVIAYIQERAGLLQARDNRTYAFPHRTFQEYLAATHILKQSEPDRLLRDRVRRDLAWWREVFLLAAGAARNTPYMISLLVNRLLPGDPPASPISAVDHEQARLAGQALHESNFAEHARKEEADEAGPFSQTYRRIQRWLVTALSAQTGLSARERAAAGATLARLGDPRPEVGVEPRNLIPLADMQFCFIAPGPFWMGSDKKDKMAFVGDETPQHKIDLPYAYWLGRYPVTNAQFQTFVRAEGYKNAAYWAEAIAIDAWREGQAIRGLYQLDKNNQLKRVATEEADKPYDFGEPYNLPNHPVVGLNWYEALAFCRWLTGEWRQAGLLPPNWQVTLPSEAEWEKAARGGLEIPEQPMIATVGASAFTSLPKALLIKNGAPKRRYPWGGDEADPDRANYNDTKIGTTSAVGCFPGGASPYGCEEIIGNVWEWTRSLWGKNLQNPDFKYPYQPGDGRESLEATPEILRVLRGGAFVSNDRFARCAIRGRYDPDLRYRIRGFRCVVVGVASRFL